MRSKVVHDNIHIYLSRSIARQQTVGTYSSSINEWCEHMSQRKANGDGSAQSVGISRRSVLGAWWKCQVQREQGARKREPFGQFCQVLLWTLNSWKVLMSSFIIQRQLLDSMSRRLFWIRPFKHCHRPRVFMCDMSIVPKNKLRQNST